MAAIPANIEAVVLGGDLNVTRALGRAGIRSAVLSSRPDDRAFRSRFCLTHGRVPNPLTEPDAFIDALLRFGAAAGNRPGLYYGDDHSLQLVSDHRDRLSPHFSFLMPDPDLVRALVDKVAFALLARRFALPVPATLLSTEAQGADDVLERVEMPCVLKPAVRRGWFNSALVSELGGKPQKAIIVERAADLRNLYPKMVAYNPEFLVQAAVPGGDDEIFSYHAYYDRRGEVLGSFIGRKVRTFPRGTGISSFLRLVRHDELLEIGHGIGRTLGLRGIVKMDFKRDPRTRRMYLLEINPRYNLWHYLGAACGVNLPWLAQQETRTGRAPAAPGEYRTDLHWLGFREDVKALLEAREEGLGAIARQLASYRRRKIYTVFAWNDPAPWAFSLAQSLQQKLRRARPSAGRTTPATQKGR